MKKNVLVADDEIESLGFIIEALEDYGFSVTSAKTGEDAVKLAEKSFYDIVLMDFNLPGINGIEAFRRIKKVSPLSMVIMITAAMPENSVKEAVAEGSFAVLYKPFKVEDLVDKIKAALNKVTAIIVDDHFTDREVLKDLLEQKGCKCASLPDGVRAIEMLKHEKPDIIFIDVSMPRMNGFEVLKEIKEIYPDISVIMMTAYGKTEYLEMALKMGALTCMYKPLNIERILEIIDIVKKKY